MKRKTLMAIVGMAFSAGSTAAQDAVDAGTIVLENLSYGPLYSSNSWSVDALFGADVVSSDGTRIGDVEDFVLNDEGEIIALIAEIGGFWDIGDTHVSVPWDLVQWGNSGSLAIPVTEDTIDQFDLFSSSPLANDVSVADEIVEGVDDEQLGSDVWRASELIGDYVRVRGEGELWVNFGYVSDMLIDDGTISATLVSTTARYGPGTYAYPYRGSSAQGYDFWRPDATYQDIPVLIGDATSMAPFDPNQMQSN